MMVLRLHSLSSRCAPLLLLATAGVVANVEKVIFNGPAPANIHLAKPSLADLNLYSLTPESSVIRTNLSRAFASDPEPRGTSAWLLLDRLVEGQVYEVRVCWAAIVRCALLELRLAGSPSPPAIEPSVCVAHSRSQRDAGTYQLHSRRP